MWITYFILLIICMALLKLLYNIYKESDEYKNQDNTQEVGVTAGTINFLSAFDQGDQILQGVSITGRSGLPNAYNYTGAGLPVSPVASTLLLNGQTINNYEILLGSNTWTSSVSYDVGPQPFDSDGNPFSTPLPAGTTGVEATTITGIYPWFYGKVGGAVRPTANQILIDGALNKKVETSNASIAVTDYNASGEWIWFAIPNTSTAKLKWDGSNSPSNTGAIGGVVSAGGNLFPDPDVISIDSPTSLWSSVNYKVYISNFPTSTFDS